MADALPLLRATQTSCTCRVCLDVLKDPIAFHCGHVLCRTCAERCLAARPRCPLCNHTVPNARHVLPLPQLSLFCVAVREVGLRVQRAHPHSNTAAETAASTEDQAEKRPHTQAQQTALPQPMQSPITAQHLSEMLLLRGALHDTQRLGSESPEETPLHIPQAAARSAGAKRKREAGDLHPLAAAATAVAEPVESASRAACPDAREQTSSPTTPTLALLQAHFAEEAEQLESTPRLPQNSRESHEDEDEESEEVARATAAADTVENAAHRGGSDVPFASGHSLDEEASSPHWRLWRRGKGVLSCALRPPAVRLAAAAQQRQAAEAQAQGNTKPAEGGTTVTSHPSRGHQRRTSTATTMAAAATEPLHPLSSSDAVRLHRSGACLLCGLDVVHRTAVRHRLQRLLRSPLAQCDATELSAQTEDSLALLLGPLWEVVCTYDFTTASSATGGAGGGVDGVYTVMQDGGDDAAATEPGPELLHGVAHHNCLCWAGLLDLYTDTSSSSFLSPNTTAAAAVTTKRVLQMAVPVVDPVQVCAAHTSGRVARWQLLAATLWRLQRLCSVDGATTAAKLGGVTETDGASEDQDQQQQQHSGTSVGVVPRCAFCTAPTSTSPTPPDDLFGVGLRTCEAVDRGESTCGRRYHYPCALLAGASACLVFGLEDDANVLQQRDDVCVRGVSKGDKTVRTTAAAHEAAPPVEVWCAACHGRHVSRRRPRAL